MDSTKFHEEDEIEKIEDHPDEQQDDDGFSRKATPEDDTEKKKFENDLNNDDSHESDENEEAEETKPTKRKWSDGFRNFFGGRALSRAREIDFRSFRVQPENRPTSLARQPLKHQRRRTRSARVSNLKRARCT